ncbi:hypothetical protein Tco_1274262 [Tanacetum coccineum]
MHIFHKDWISTLKERADCLLETINHHFASVVSDKSAPLETNCDTLLRAAYRELDDDYLYCPSSKEVSEKNDLILFRQHSTKGHPVIVTDVLKKTTGLRWEPMVMSRAIELHLNPNHSSKRSKVSTINCFTGCEEIISSFNFFKGYAEQKQYKKSQPKLLKLKDFPPKHNFLDVLPRHFDEFISVLPFPEYTNPETSPKAYIAYGNLEKVNILLHNTEVSYSDKEETGGALWDIFRREDEENLVAYLFNHYTEFQYPCGCPVDKVYNPIHDQTFYLTLKHKKKLKEEYGLTEGRISSRNVPRFELVTLEKNKRKGQRTERSGITEISYILEAFDEFRWIWFSTNIMKRDKITETKATKLAKLWALCLQMKGSVTVTVSRSSQASTYDVNSCKRSFSQTLSTQRPFSIREVLQQQNSTDDLQLFVSVANVGYFRFIQALVNILVIKARQH